MSWKLYFISYIACNAVKPTKTSCSSCFSTKNMFFDQQLHEIVVFRLSNKWKKFYNLKVKNLCYTPVNMVLDHFSFCCISFRAFHLQSITAHHTQADTWFTQTCVTTKTWLKYAELHIFITELLALFPQRCTPSMKLSVRPYSGLITFEDVILGNNKPATSSVACSS